MISVRQGDTFQYIILSFLKINDISFLITTMTYPAIRIIQTNKQIVGLLIANPFIGS
jgi:hypothetical protein